jgi:rhodanese-related sulfurtransferase
MRVGMPTNPNKEHLGGNLTPMEAFQMVKKDPEHTFLVDCRTRAEYQYVGHPEGAYNIPIRFLSEKVGEKGYTEIENPDFGKALLDRFNPETDTLIIFAAAEIEAAKAAMRRSR